MQPITTTYRSETAVTPNGARVEIATVTHDGKDFSATGSIIDESGGFLLGYPKGRELQTWDGKKIGVLSVTGHARGFGGARLTCWALELNGRHYHGRNAGEGMVLRMRAKKTKR